MYEVLSRCYDRFVGVDYDSLAAVVSSVLQAFDVRGRVLDLACGTGELTARLKLSGLNMTGADLSENMLNIARKKCGAEFLKLDMTELCFDSEFEAVVCTLDVINHLDSLDMVEKVFSGVNRALVSGGVFIFDINSVYKHKEILGNNTFTYNEDDMRLVWENRLLDRNRAEISLSLTLKTPEGEEHLSESFIETAWELDDVKQRLKKCGFAIDEIYSGFFMDEPDNETERYFFIARKI